MTEAPRTPEGEQTPEPRELLTLDERLDFLRTRFITHTETIKPLPDVAEPGEETAKVYVTEAVYSGELTDDVKGKIKKELGVDLNAEPEYVLDGSLTYKIYQVPESEPPFSIIRMEAENGEVDILQYEDSNLEMFAEIEGLEKRE